MSTSDDWVAEESTRLVVSARDPLGLTGSGHGRCIGRVGALAVALGVGMAITLAAPLAAADPSGSAPSGDSGSASAGDSAKRPAGPAGRQQRRTQSIPASAPADDSASGVPGQRNRGRVGSAAAAVAPAAGSDIADIAGIGARIGTGIGAAKSKAGSDALGAILGNGRSQGGGASGPVVGGGAPVVVAPASAAVPAAIGAAVGPAAAVAPQSVPGVVAPAVQSAPTVKPVGIRAVFAGLLGGSSPQSPASSPLSWVVMAAALGQIGQGRAGSGVSRTAAPSAASVPTLVAGTPTVGAPDVRTGAVYGGAKFVNTAGGTMAYSVSPTSAGGGAVTINAANGAFSYTPTPVQRQSAGLATTDTFTVTATNGNLVAYQTITVPVDPGTAVAGTPWLRGPVVASGVVGGIAKFTDGSGRTLTYSAPSSSSGGAAVSINAATGDFTYTPTQAQRQSAGLATTDSFTVSVSNGVRTTTQTITVGVDPGTPVAGSPWVRTPVASSGVVGGIAKFTDGSGRALTYSAPASSTGGGAVSINAATGDFTYTPTRAQRQNAGLSTTDSFTVSVNNGIRTTAQTITVPVDPGTPTAGSPTVGTANLSTGVVAGTARGTDSAGRTLSYTAPSTSTGGGTVSVNSGTGAFTYTPNQAQRQNAGLGATDTFTVTISNGVRSTTQAVTVGVDPGTPVAATPWVRPPVVASGVVTGIAKVTDSVGGPLTFSAPSTSSGGGTVSINAGTGDFTYTPTQGQRRNAGLSTTDSFTVTVSNGARTTTQAITVPVDPGTAVAGTPWVRTPAASNGVVTGVAKFTDGSGRTLTYSAPASSTGGGAVSINAATGDFTYTPTLTQRRNAGLSTTDSFTVSVSNGVRTTTQAVTVAVDPGTPTAGTPWVRTPSTTTGVVTGIAKGTDSVGGPLSFSVAPTSSGGGAVSINAGTGDFTYTPTQAQRQNAGLSTTDTFGVTISNGARTTTQTVTVAVDPGTPTAGTPWLRTPVASSGVVTGIAKGTDSVGGPLSFSVAPTSSGGGAVSINAGTGDFTYTPTQAQRQSAGVSTTDSFTVTISNGARTTTRSVTVPVDPGSPVAASPWVRTPINATGVVTGIAKFTDGSARTLTYSVPSGTSGGAAVSINASTGDFTYTPTLTQRRNAGLSTTDSFTVTATNGVRTTTQTITVPVDPGTPTAGTPWVRTPNRTTGTVTGIARFTDPVGRVLTYSAAPSSVGGGAVGINSATGDFTYTPTQAQRQVAAQSTTDTFTVTASNGLRTTTQTVTVSVDPNAAPVIGNPALNYLADGVVSGQATVTDADADPVTLTATPITNGTLTAFNGATGQFTYTPTWQARHNAAANWASYGDRTASFTLTANDGRGGVTPYVVAINVAPINTAPTGTSSFGAPSEVTGQASGALTFTDADNDTLSYLVATGPGSGSIAFDPSVAGAFTYTPTWQARHYAAADGVGPQSDTFTLAVDDGHGGRVTIPFTVGITPTNEPLAQTATVGAPDPYEASMVVSVYDPDGDVPTYTVTDIATDPFRAQTALALRMYGINNSTTFIDSSINRFTVTPVNGAKISTAQGVSDGSSGEFSRSGYLSVTGGSPSAIPSGNDQYTIEAWINPRSYSGAQGIVGWGSYANTNQVNALGLGQDGRLVNYWSGNDLATAPVVALNTWTHVATSFDGTTRRIFVNGVLVASDTPTGHNVTNVDNLTVGLTWSDELFDGYIDDVRITKGVRYAANFTPPTLVAPKGSVSVNGGSVVYTPDRAISHAIAEGAPAVTDSFTLTANDGHGSQRTMPVNLTIGPANYAPIYSTLTMGAPHAGSGEVTGTITATDAVDNDVRTYSIARGPVNGGTVTIDSATGAFTYTPSASGRQNATTAPTAVGLLAGKWGENQVHSVSRRLPGCAQAGGLCEVTGFSEPYVDNYWWRWWDRPTWNTGDYVKLVDTGRNLWSGAPELSLVQYTSNGSQKQVIAASGYVESLGSGIVYIGAAGNTAYYISNAVGIGRYSGGSYSYVVDSVAPNRATLGSYVVNTVPLNNGQVLASTDTFTVAVTDTHGGSNTTTISVPVPPGT